MFRLAWRDDRRFYPVLLKVSSHCILLYTRMRYSRSPPQFIWHHGGRRQYRRGVSGLSARQSWDMATRLTGLPVFDLEGIDLRKQGNPRRATAFRSQHERVLSSTGMLSVSAVQAYGRDGNPNHSSRVVEELAKSLDLNTLYHLSSTCRLFRANLLQYRKQLISSALRCVNDGRQRAIELVSMPDHRQAQQPYAFHNARRTMTSGKVGPCARDLVGECRRCGVMVVCRNCSMKPPSAATHSNRLRRLCPTCSRAPLSELLAPQIPSLIEQAFTYKAFIREPCSCTEAFFLCRPCGRYAANADTDYNRIWIWRTRYSTYLGGLGTGIGEGNEGVKCARGENCIDSRNIEVEMDCDGTPDEVDSRPGSQPSGAKSTLTHEAIGEMEKPGYFRQEMEGIGGVVRGKYKKMVRVGRTVEEYEDERDSGEYLGREAHRKHRSWCGWCDRVVPGKHDMDIL